MRAAPALPKRPETIQANLQRLKEVTQRAYAKAEEIKNKSEVMVSDTYERSGSTEVGEVFKVEFDPESGDLSSFRYREDVLEDGHIKERYMLTMDMDSGYGLTKEDGTFAPAERFMAESWAQYGDGIEHFSTRVYTDADGESLIDTSTSDWGIHEGQQGYIQHADAEGRALGSLFKLVGS